MTMTDGPQEVPSTQDPVVPHPALARRWGTARLRDHAGSAESHQRQGAAVAGDALWIDQAAHRSGTDRGIGRAARAGDWMMRAAAITG